MNNLDKNRSNLTFKKLRTKLTIGLLAAFILPYAGLMVFFNYQFNLIINETGKRSLIALSESQRNTIDLFLEERVINLFNLFHRPDFHTDPQKINMDELLKNLRQISDTFIDLGFLNAKGIQVGYAGPYRHLQNRDYSDQSWFKTITGQKQDYHITDIYLGFRNKAHFAITVRQEIEGQLYLFRTTLEPDQFYNFLRTINEEKGVESLLVNAAGIYQVVGPNVGKPFDFGEYVPDLNKLSDAVALRKKGDSIMIAHSWLKETRWALLVRQPYSLVYAEMQHTRQTITALLAFVLIIFGVIIWFTTSRLIDYARKATEKSDDMRMQLVHATKLASIGELSAGIAHEINNPLAIIIATSGVVRDMLNPEFGIQWNPPDLLKELDTINAAVFRAKNITSKLLDYGRKNKPHLVPSNVNQLLDGIINGLIEREFSVVDINLLRRYDPDIPQVLMDPDQMSQVFLNLINNAGDAIKGPGTITVTTTHTEENIQISITDTGVGMSIDQLKQIFNPFFTTKEVGKGTGLGLGISLSIVESLGGTIDVQSMQGIGSSFIITLPIHQEVQS